LATFTPNPIHELVHPSDSFTFLQAVTLHILRLSSSSSQARSLFVREHADSLLLRIQAEWRAWLVRIHMHVNVSGGIYGRDTAEGWIRGLDEIVNLENALPPLPSRTSEEDANSDADSLSGIAELHASKGGSTNKVRVRRPLPRHENQTGQLDSAQSHSSNTGAQNTAQIFLQDKPMRILRDEWIAKVGWLVGRRVVRSGSEDMDEDEVL
jgi:hypothetical protein